MSPQRWREPERRPATTASWWPAAPSTSPGRRSKPPARWRPPASSGLV